MITKLLRMLNPRWHLIKAEVARHHAGPYVEENVLGYSIAIIYRGEQLLYTDSNGALIVEISVPGKWVDAASIRKWNEIQRVSAVQRKMILNRIEEYFKNTQKLSIDVINA